MDQKDVCVCNKWVWSGALLGAAGVEGYPSISRGRGALIRFQNEYVMTKPLQGSWDTRIQTQLFPWTPPNTT